jgi:tetratricopeptide (TPR) repeat protein
MNHRRLAALCLAAVAWYGAGLDAIFVLPETRKVPVARLVANLEKELAAGPATVDLHLRLARLYGMAYALNADEVPVAVRPAGPGGERQAEEIWLGPSPQLIPRQLAPETTRTATSRKYLGQAVEHYRRALELDADNLTARLGYAWTLDQSGDKQAAIPEYRRVIDEAWPKEQATRFAMLGQRFYTEEAATYLIRLLDPIADDREITELRDRAKRLGRVPRPVTPIAIPLADHLTIRDVVDLDARVSFDADGSGTRRHWTWISSRAGWLVYDGAGRGDISSALQLFGNVTFWLFWTNGYEPLRALDENGDRELAGEELRGLAVWTDTNRNGISDPREVLPLSAHGIVSLSCRYEAGDGTLAVAQAPTGMRLSDGRVRPTFDVLLRPAGSVSVP